MSVRYKYSGLTEELYKRLVSEHAALKQAHKKGTYKQFFQEVRQCSEVQARIIYQAFNSAVVERARISSATVDRLEGIISDELFNDLQDYLSTNYTRGQTTRQFLDKTNAGLPDELFKRFCDEVEAMREVYGKRVTTHIMGLIGCTREEARKHADNLSKLYREINRLTPRKLIQIEGLISDELFGDIAKYVFNNYDWAADLDEDIDRIARKYRSKEVLGRNKPTVKHYLYRAYMLGV